MIKHNIFKMLLISAFAFINCQISAQSNLCNKNLLIAFYNTENLFDTIHDQSKLDIEFTPDGNKKWTSERYLTKIQNISKVISSYDSKKLPDIVGLCEIENRKVVNDLINSNNLKKGKYSIIHHESPDIRGIDVALIYKKTNLNLISEKNYPVTLTNDARFKTRDILYAKFYVKGAKDTLHIFVNHWPSRLGGEEKSRNKRAAAAMVVKHLTDSLSKLNFKVKLLIMGDLNDEPLDFSVKEVLKAGRTDTLINSNSLYDLCLKEQLNHEGSYYYWAENKWNMIDNMIVNGNLLYAANGLKINKTQIIIFKPDWVLTADKKGGNIPFKTYGKGYTGGFSDHLSIFTYLCFINKNK